MEAKEEKITLDYSIGDSAGKEDTVIISISGTGMRASNKEHLKTMEVMVKVIAAEMYAKANNLPIEHKFKIKK